MSKETKSKNSVSRNFNWCKDGVAYTYQFLKKHNINWKSVAENIRYGIVKSNTEPELDFWLNFLKDYQAYKNIKAM